jgi:hypothetical protein
MMETLPWVAVVFGGFLLSESTDENRMFSKWAMAQTAGANRHVDK